jgi:excisionase family DNA binding protein
MTQRNSDTFQPSTASPGQVGGTRSPSLLSRKQAAEYLGVKEQTLACWVTTKRYALPYVKVGRLVKYRREDVERFIQENRFDLGGDHE